MRRIHTTFSKSLTSLPLNFFSLECKTKVCLWLEKQQFDHINVNEKRASSQCLLVLNPCFQSTTREREHKIDKKTCSVDEIEFLVWRNLFLRFWIVKRYIYIFPATFGPFCCYILLGRLNADAVETISLENFVHFW